MDQLRTIFAQLKKYHFWILCVLVVIVGLTSWYLSTSNLEKVTKANAEEIKKKNKEVLAISKIAPHPNDIFLTGMDKIIHQHAMSIGVGWQKRYAQQEKLLVWPKILTQEFIREVDPLRPIENVPFPTPAAQEINPENREIYRNFITSVLPELANTIGATWYAKVGEGGTSGGGAGGMSMPRAASGGGGMRPPGGGGMGSMRPSGGGSGGMRPPGGGGLRPGGSNGRMGETAEEVDKSIVKWDPANQQEILNEHFGFASRGVEPSTLEVLYAQEDFWVLQAIMNIIKRTNGDADAYYNVPIKDIQTIQIGRTVVGRMGLVSPIFQQAGGGSSGGMGMPNSMSPSQSMSSPAGGMTPPTGGAPSAAGGPPGSGGMPGMPGASGAADSLDPALGRYVDVDYNPLPPADLRAALTSKDSKLAVYAVAKRMPVRLRFKMDQRRLSDLLAECGNSSLPVEVRQVRINCPAGLASSTGTATGSGSMMPMSGGGGAAFKSSGMPSPSSGGSASRPRSGGAGGGMLSSMGGASNNAPEVDPNEAEIEVYGIVHIFNPVNQKQLGIELRESPSGQPDEAAAPSEPTAVVPVAVPTRG